MKKLRIEQCIFFSIVLLFLLRVIALDKDVPDWGVAGYTPLDEGYYAMQALENVNEDWRKVGELEGNQYSSWNSSVCFSLTFFTSFFLKIFGRNYYGLRMGAFIASFIVFILLYYMIYREDISNKKWKSAVCALLLSFNFPFFLASRIVEPTIFRCMLLMVTIYVVWRGKRSGMMPYFRIGFLTGISITFGYITNIFALLPCAVLVLLEIFWQKGKKFKAFGECILGGLLAMVLSEVIMYLLQERTFLQDTFRILSSNIGEQRVQLQIGSIYANLRATMKGNIFVYCAPLFAIMLISTICLILKGFKQRDRFQIYLVFWCIGYWIMSLVSADFPQRKTLILLPVIVLMFFWQWNQTEAGNVRLVYKIGISMLLLLSLVNSVKEILAFHTVDMNERTRIILLISGSFLTLILIICVFFRERTIIMISGGIVSIGLFFINDMFLGYEYVKKAGTDEKEIMMQIGDIVGNDYVMGDGFSYALYNDIIPVLGCYDAYFENIYNEKARTFLLEDDVKYYIGYANDSTIDKWLEGTEYCWQVEKLFTHDYQVYFYDTTDICLYKKVLR